MAILTFGVVDYVVLAIVLFIPMIIGLIFRFKGGKENTLSDYLMGSRRMSSVPVGISLAVSFVSAVTILGASAEIYVYGITLLFRYFGGMIGLLLALWLVVPLYHSLKLTSINQVTWRPEAFNYIYSQTLCSGFHYETYIGLSPYHTLV